MIGICDNTVHVGMSEHDIDKLVAEKPFKVCEIAQSLQTKTAHIMFVYVLFLIITVSSICDYWGNNANTHTYFV